ncbi:hypothetical protein [Methanoregula sp.]|uniref:hypothetical protein n=1 Tax=Methanoregula sp. TaxID=2052170 RepID=UPI003C750776
MKNVQEPTYSFVILTLILIVVDTFLALISVKLIPAAAGGPVSPLFIAVAFMILFTLWFGAYGAIAAYVGTLVGAGLLAADSFSQHPEIAILWAVAGLLQVLIPLVAVRSFDVDLAMENPRDLTYVLIFGVIVNNLVGAAWGTWTLALAQTVNTGSIFGTWLIGNIIVTILIVPLALKHFTPKVRKSKLFVKNYWD